MVGYCVLLKLQFACKSRLWNVANSTSYCTKTHHFGMKISKFFWGGGIALTPDPSLGGEVDTPFPHPIPSAPAAPAEPRSAFLHLVFFLQINHWTGLTTLKFRKYCYANFLYVFLNFFLINVVEWFDCSELRQLQLYWWREHKYQWRKQYCGTGSVCRHFVPYVENCCLLSRCLRRYDLYLRLRNLSCLLDAQVKIGYMFTRHTIVRGVRTVCLLQVLFIIFLSGFLQTVW